MFFNIYDNLLTDLRLSWRISPAITSSLYLRFSWAAQSLDTHTPRLDTLLIRCCCVTCGRPTPATAEVLTLYGRLLDWRLPKFAPKIPAEAI